MKAIDQIKLKNKYGQRHKPIPAPKIEENKKKYNRKKLKRIKEDDEE